MISKWPYIDLNYKSMIVKHSTKSKHNLLMWRVVLDCVSFGFYIYDFFIYMLGLVGLLGSLTYIYLTTIMNLNLVEKGGKGAKETFK